MTEKKVLVYGSLNLDHVYSVDHFAGPGETIPARDMKVSCGGKGLNQAVAFAKAGAQTYLAGKTGSGGDLLRDTCREYGVHTDYLKSCSEPGGHAVIQVDAQGQNSIIIFGGTNRMQTEEEISHVLEQFGGGYIYRVFLCGDPAGQDRRAGSADSLTGCSHHGVKAGGCSGDPVSAGSIR